MLGVPGNEVNQAVSSWPCQIRLVRRPGAVPALTSSLVQGAASRDAEPTTCSHMIKMDQLLCTCCNRQPWLGWNCFTPNCLQRGTGNDWDPGRGVKWETISNSTPSPPDWICIMTGSGASHSNDSSIVGGQSHNLPVSVNHNFWGEREELKQIKQRSFCLAPYLLAKLAHTGIHGTLLPILGLHTSGPLHTTCKCIIF